MAPYKAADTSVLTSWDIRKGKTVGGISGNLSFFKNAANTTFFDRSTGSGAATGLDYYDNVNEAAGIMPSELPSGWAYPSSSNWATVVASTSYKDLITGLIWLKDQGTSLSGSNASQYADDAISRCESATDGGRSDWRLPTQKELMQAYVDGIGTQASGLGIQDSYYHSATYGAYFGTYNAVNVITGVDQALDTAANRRVICVAP